MKPSHLRGIAIAAAAIAFAAPASAVPIKVEFNIVGFGAFTADTGSVATATRITTGAPNFVANVLSSNVGLTSPPPLVATTLAPDPLPVFVDGVFTKEFTTELGTFRETLTVTSTSPSSNALGVLASGTIIQIAGTGLFDPTPVFWSSSYTQNQGGQISGTFNNSTTPPQVVPEPLTLALIGVGVAGIGVSRRRRG